MLDLVLKFYDLLFIYERYRIELEAIFFLLNMYKCKNYALPLDFSGSRQVYVQHNYSHVDTISD